MSGAGTAKKNDPRVLCAWVKKIRQLMDLLTNFGYLLLAMTLLTGASGFFSCSEAALFYLTRQDRRRLDSGNPAQRMALSLLNQPERLLTAVLFWNLIINITYFAISSIIGTKLEDEQRLADAGVLVLGSVLTIIIFSEMLPKSLGVLYPRLVATLVSVPLAAAVRVLDPFMSTFRFVNLISRRIFWPQFQPEAYLEVDDLERAIELSVSDATLLEQERTVLQNIVSLSELRADELMRPRRQFLAFRPPVSLRALEGEITPSGYLLVTEPDTDEVTGAIGLKHLSDLPDEHLEYHAEKVIYVPWCATVAAVLQEMRHRDREVAAVVNEYGETIGIVTLEDILSTIFQDHSRHGASPSETASITQVQPRMWHLSGMTSVRRLGKQLQIELPETKAVTVAGVMQEVLQRFPNAKDQCEWGQFRFEVLEASEDGQLNLRLTLRE